MCQHLQTDLLERCGDHALSAVELLALDDHVNTCLRCRETLRRAKSTAPSLVTLRLSLRLAPDCTLVHLSEPRLSDFINRRLDDADNELAETHLEMCSRCAIEAHRLAIETHQTSKDSSARHLDTQTQTEALAPLPTESFRENIQSRDA